MWPFLKRYAHICSNAKLFYLKVYIVENKNTSLENCHFKVIRFIGWQPISQSQTEYAYFISK